MNQRALPSSATSGVAEIGRHRTRRPTIRDVACASQVSIGTVSKALKEGTPPRGDAGQSYRGCKRTWISPERPGSKSSSRSEHDRRIDLYSTRLVASRIPIMQGIEERLSAGGVAVFMCNATDDPAKEAWHVEQLLCKRVDGIIVTARRADQRTDSNARAASRWSTHSRMLANLTHARPARRDAGGVALAVRHLTELGRERIAHIAGPGDLKQWSCGETATEER